MMPNNFSGELESRRMQVLHEKEREGERDN